MDHPIVVLGLGNLLYGDEGFGVIALQALYEQVGDLPNVEFVDGGTLGLNLLPVIETSGCLLGLDAIDAGTAPGTVFEMDGTELPMFSTQKLSEHQVGFQEVLGLAAFRGCLPGRFKIIAIQPGTLDAGVALSSEAEAALPVVIQRSRRILTEWIERAI